MNIYIPFVYCITFLPTGKRYYGSRYANNKKEVAHPSQLWSTYFTSSETIKALIEEYGVDSFTFEVRKTFKTRKETLSWETKFLTKIDAAKHPEWINGHNGGSNFHSTIEGVSKSSLTKKSWSKDKHTAFCLSQSINTSNYYLNASTNKLEATYQKHSNTLQDKSQDYWDNINVKKRKTNSIKSEETLKQEKINYSEASKLRWIAKLNISPILHCPNCIKTYTILPFYEKHLTKCKPTTYLHYCPTCNKGYNEVKWLNVHLRKNCCSTIPQ